MTEQTTISQLPGMLRFLVKLFQLILYIPLQILFIPLAIVGIIDGMIKEMVKSKQLGVSFSAIKALQYRFYMHYFETRPDPYTVAFTKEFPCESHFGLWSIMGALITAQRLFGFKTSLSEVAEPGAANLGDTSSSRVVTFDRIMEKFVDDVEQIVIPGVGYDLIALHFTKGKAVKVFELDQVNTLNLKVETLKSAGIEHDWITFVPVDYATESWVEKLVDAGFDKTKKTLFVWQSVSLFLDAEIVKDTLRQMADLCVDGSVIAQDFVSEDYMSGEVSKMAKKQMDMIENMGEPWKFGIDMSEDPEAAVESFLRECGLKMTEFIQFGEQLAMEPFYCVVEAEKL